MLAEMNWILAIPASIFGTICFTLPLVLCVCGCKTKELKDDFIGVEGKVKITNPEEYEREVNDNNISSDVTDKVNTAKRSLPDLPVDLHTHGRNDISWEPNNDTTSELYATVVVHDEKNEKHIWQKSRSSNSPSLNYSNVKEDHQYDKLQKVENPYAQVNGNGKKEEILTSYININRETENVQNDENTVELLISQVPAHESTSNIPAANAIAGHVIANDDLPYMTPPTHFSGDSQDSGKGYTSISVREPLSTIQAETIANKNFKLDSHYATVSDDSDDMYAAIDDPTQLYISENETYAQIHTESNKLNSVPQPPSVDSLKQMTNFSHSQQTSTSSLTSSNQVNSCKQDKRLTNSFLPSTPNKSSELMEDLYSTIGKNLKEESFPTALEDMYAKVNKKIRRETEHLERNDSTESGVSESSDSLSYKLQSTTTAESSRSCHSYLSKSTLTDTSTSPTNRRGETSFSSDTDSHSNFEKLGISSICYDEKFDPGYETVNKGIVLETDPEYEKLKSNKYDIDDRCKGQNLNFVNIDQVESDVSDGYTTLKPGNEIYSKININENEGYARVQSNDGSNNEGYATVLKFYKDRPEPNYEKVLFSNTQQDLKFTKRSIEPTYESLNNEFEGEDLNDPKYESVRFLQHSIVTEPPYQLLKECESGATEN